MATLHHGFVYSEKFTDDKYEYRHVILPSHVSQRIRKGKILNEREWRSLGVQQSKGWVHYDWHNPEGHILLFRRAKPVGARAM
jgi:cyclin-dependent kinase regulatory subunit CKS1